VDTIGKAAASKLLRALRFIGQAAYFRVRHGVRAFFYIPAPGSRAAVYRDWLVIGCCRLFFPVRVYYWQAAGLSDWLEQHARPWERWLSTRLLGGPHLSIVLANMHRRDAEWARSGQTVVVPNGIPDPCPDYRDTLEPVRRERAAARLKSQRTNTAPGAVFNLLFIGICCREKGLFDAVEGVALANRKLENLGSPFRAKLTVAGKFFTGDEADEFQKRCQQPDLAGAIDYRGFVSGHEKQSLFEEADCLLFPTYYAAESFGIVLIEAMAFGLSIVTTRWRHIPELLPPDYPGIVNPRDPLAIAQAIERQISADYDPALRAQFEQEYTIEQHVARVRAALLNLNVGP
jgi:glycosyltransferase involved in cell wall biosynthesis